MHISKSIRAVSIEFYGNNAEAVDSVSDRQTEVPIDKHSNKTCRSYTEEDPIHVRYLFPNLQH